MELKDWLQLITILVAGVVAALGWYVNGALNRKNEIAKKKLDYRLPALKSFLELWYFIQQWGKTNSLNLEKYTELIERVREDFQLYGEKDEIKLYEEFVDSVQGVNLNVGKAKATLQELVKLVRIRIRKELRIK